MYMEKVLNGYLLPIVHFIINKFDPDTELTLRPQPHYKKMDLTQHLEHYDIETQIYKIKTDDGYILQAFNMYERNDEAPHNKTPVLLVHGLTADCTSYFFVEIHNTIPYRLIKRKYNVWCLNLRGTKQSRNHERYKSDSYEFWDFSIHENGMYDITATIDFITEHTGHKKVIYIGHSAANTAFFIMNSEKPEYNGKIDHMYGLGPSLTSKYELIPDHAALLLLPLFKVIGNIMYVVVIPREQIRQLCQLITNTLCTLVVSAIFGFNPQYADYTVTPTETSGAPTSFAIKQLLMIAETALTGNFKAYDHGKSRNMEVYGTPTSPFYKLENVQAPITLFCGAGDIWTPIKEGISILRHVRNSKMYVVPCGYWNHGDFIAGRNVTECVYNKIFDELMINHGH